ncbi:hypothetical protein G6F56_003299 [Rhizopus delemar]|nr:hypothetical protein G6F56_003299 [Rhizopus delemar]
MNMPILNINAEMNMDSLQVLTQSKETREYGLFVVNTHILQEKKQEIFTLSKIQTQLNYLFSYTNYNMDVLKKHYDVYSRQNKRVIDNAMDVTIKNSGQTDNPMPEVELVMLLATGGFSLVTKTLLLEYLTPQSIKTWETTSINEYKQLQQILCNYVLPSLERIMVQLSQLLGYGRWKERYCDFIDPSSVEKWIDCVQKLIGRVLELTDRLRRLLKMFGAFVKWLHIESEELQSLSSLCEEPDLVFEYLEEWFIKDKLAEYFIDSNGKSLSTQLSDLEKSCSFPLQKPSEALSKKMQITSTHIFKLDIISPKNPSRNDIASFTSNDAELQTTYYAFINQDKKVVILKSDFTKTNFQYVCLNTTEDNVSDMEFFDHQELCIVTYNKNDTILYTVQLDQLEYKDFTLKIESEDIKFGRSLVLNRMIQAKLGCNGLPKRRIFATVASNGILNIYSMDKLEE